MLPQILDIRTCISLDRLPEPLQPTFPLLCLGRNLRNDRYQLVNSLVDVVP